MNNLGNLSIDIIANIANLQRDMGRVDSLVTGTMSRVESSVGSAMRVLGGLGVGLSFAGLAGGLKRIVDAVDSLNDLKDATGASIENLSGLQDVARRTGTAMDAVGSSVVRFNKALGDKGAETVFKALNLDIAQLKSLDPAQALHLTAKALSEYADDGNKARAVQELFGKSVQEVAPFLKDLADQTELTAKVTTLQAEEAEKLNKILFALSASSEDAGRQLATGFLPVLINIAEAMSDVEDKAKGLSTIGEALRTPFEAVAVLGINVAFVFKAIGKDIGSMMAQLEAASRFDFNGFSQIHKDRKEEADRERRDIDARSRGILYRASDYPQASYGNEGRSATPTKGTIGDIAQADVKAVKVAKQAVDEYAQLVSKLTAKDTGFDADFAKNFQLIFDGGKKAGVAIAEIIRLQDLYIAQQPVMVKYQKDKAAADEAAAKFVKQLVEEAQKEVDAEFKVAESLAAKAQAQEVANLTFDKGRSAVEELALVEMQRRLTMLDSTESVIPGMVAATEQQIEAQKRLIDALKQEEALQKAKKDQEAFKSLIDGVDKAGFDGLFNGSLKGVSKLIESVKLLGKLQTDGEKARMGAAVQYGETSEEYAAALKGIEQDKQRVSLQTYSAMAGAAKGFFEEGTKGYKAMEIAETSFALAAAVSAIASQGKGDPYTAIPRMLAVAGLLMQLGVQLNGLSGASAAPVTNQGKGTVFGDSDAKSQSIQNSIKLLAETSTLGLRYSAQMANSLKNIEAAFAGVTNLVLRNGQISKLEASIQTGATNSSTGRLVASNDIGNHLTGGALSGFFSGLATKLFGNKISIQGSGILGGPQSFGGIQDLGFQGNYYADIETKKKFLGVTRSTTNSTITSALDDELARQFTQIFTSMGDSILAASQVFGLRTDGINDKLASYIVDIGKIDLRGLNGEQIQEKLSAVFGAEFDRMAAAIIPGLESIQRVGEGYGETLVRAANQLEVVDFTFNRLGGSLSLATDNLKSLDVILQKMTNPDAQPVRSGINQAVLADQLVQQFGGLEQFRTATDAFYQAFYSRQEQTRNGFESITNVLDGLSLALPTSEQQWRDITTSIDVSTEAGRELFETMVNFGPAFRELQQQLLDSAGINAGDISGLLRDGYNGDIASSELSARLSETLVGGIRNAFVTQVTDQITQSLINNVLSPMLTSMITTGNIAAAVSQAQMDAVVADATARIAGLNAIFANTDFQAAMQTLTAGIGGLAGVIGGGSGLAAQAAPAFDSLGSSVNSAADAARSGADAWKSIGNSLTDEINRIRGVVAVAGPGGERYLERQFDLANSRLVQNPADQEAYKELIKAGQSYLAIAEKSGSALDVQLKRGTVLQSLMAARDRIDGGAQPTSYASAYSAPAYSAPAVPVASLSQQGSGEVAALLEQIRMLNDKVDVLSQHAASTSKSSAATADTLDAATKGRPLRTREVAA